ncbi:MAG: type III pantothenate kinase [Parasporobacterium sp.]|nr:type III pantothenate kinase [Parasporobacterium sp.]
MLLTVDAGNTVIKFAIFDGDKIITTFRLTTSVTRTSDEFGYTITDLIERRIGKKKTINAVIISSVVPNIMHALTNCFVKYFGVTPMIVGPGIKTGIKITKASPSEVGSDRIADGAAALSIYGGPVIVVDYGTATKFDYFTEKGLFEAAITCPGIMLSAKALWGGTAKIPEIEIADPGTILVKDTITSLQAGIIYGTIGETEYIIRKIKEEAGNDNILVVATGDLARTMAAQTKAIDIVETDLTMYGLKILYEKNK